MRRPDTILDRKKTVSQGDYYANFTKQQNDDQKGAIVTAVHFSPTYLYTGPTESLCSNLENKILSNTY